LTAPTSGRADHPVLANFVNGQSVAARDGRTSDVVDPCTGEAYAQAPVSRSGDVDAALQAAGVAFEIWRDTTPAQRSLALLRFASAIEAPRGGPDRGREPQHRQAGSDDQDRRSAAAGRRAALFRRRGADSGGQVGGEYLRGHTSMIRREPVGVCAQVTPWNYPMMMAVWKLAPRTGGRQHRGAEAVRHHAGVNPAAGGDSCRVPAARRPQRDLRRL
jgi:betaine-aldehyde dehydrogenase